MQSSKYALIAVATACANSFAAADPGDIYIEGVAGTYQDGFFLFDEHEFSTLGARAGYDFNSYFAVEAEYSSGTNTHERSFALNRFPDLAQITGTSDFELDSIFGIYGKASFPLSERFAVHARAGYAEKELTLSSTAVYPEFETPVLNSGTSSEEFLSYGVGGSFDLSDKIYARADITTYGDEIIDEVYSATVSVGVRF